MQVKDLVNQYYNNLSAGSTVATKTKGVEQLVSTVSELQKGQVFEGTISSVKGNNVTLSLSNGQTISARLDGSVSLSEGESVFFQVRESDGNQVRISPVSIGGTMNNPTLMDALNSAGIPVNEKTLNLVNSMMQESMPINAENLSDMNRLLSAHPTADPKTIVSLTKNGLPVNDDMIQQYQNYKSSGGAILESVKDLTNDIFETFSSPSVSNNDTFTFLSKVADIFNGTVSISDAPTIPPEAIIAEEEVDGQKQEQVQGQGQEQEQVQETVDLPQNEKGLLEFPKEGTTIVISLKEGDIDSSLIPQNTADASVRAENIDLETLSNEKGKESGTEVKNEAIVKEDSSLIENLSPDKGEAVSNPAVAEKETERPHASFVMPSDEEVAKAPEDSLSKTVPKETMKELDSFIRNNDLSEHPAFKAIMNEDGTLKTDVPAKEVFNALLAAAKDEPSLSKRFLNEPSVKDLMKGLMEKEWTMKPEELSKPGALKDFYSKLSADMSILGKHASELSHDPKNPVTVTGNLIQNNVDFINNLNQAFSYVQVPVRMNGQNKTADLYVYTNKKKVREEGDELSAFLHFDLDNLGSTDISVKLKGKNVDTKFYMEDDASYELVKNNIHILNDQLSALGYTSKITVENDQKPVNLVKDVLEKDVSVSKTGSLQRYSFDMRA